MYEIRDELDHVRRRPETLSAAERALEELCAEAHAQAKASGEGTRDMWIRLRVVDELGETILWREYNPDPDKPYVPLHGKEEA